MSCGRATTSSLRSAISRTRKAAANRLMKNQEDIGKAVATFYGAAAGQQLTTLLKEHITIAVDLIKAAKAGDKGGATTG